MSTLPDLLHPVATARVEIGLVGEALRFAFASGGSDVTGESLFEPGIGAASSWTPDHFETDLFLTNFVQAHAQVTIRGQPYQLSVEQLHKLLRQPPDDARITRFRHHVLHELASVPGYADALDQTYVLARQLKALLSESGLGHRLDVNRRRLDILAAWRSLLLHMAERFQGAHSGLARLPEFARSTLAEPGHVRLNQLLELEQGMAALDVRLGVGYQGELRHFEIVRVSEQTANPFHATRLGRLWRKLLLFLRGYHFSDAEVLSRFVDEVFLGIEAALARVFQLLGDLEFYLAALHFRAAAARAGLDTCLPTFSPDQRAVRGLFNPLLLANAGRPTPCQLQLAAAHGAVVLTGPNSGGKTRLLQSLALSQLLAQCGFFVPAEQAQLVWAQAMFVSISEASHAGQREGRLGMELTRIRSVFEHARQGAMVVVDELCSGTNPGEGEQIFELVLSLLRQLSVQAFISTHFLQFAQRLADSRDRVQRYGLSFLCVELDATQSPTYQFVPGVARSSLALQTAARLGVTREELTALIMRHQRSAASRASAAPATVATAPARMEKVSSS
jgi:DNA mismatch repair protein MutS2